MEDRFWTIGKIAFFVYLIIWSGLGAKVLVMNSIVTLSLRKDPDPNPGVAMYFKILTPMILAFVVSVCVSTFQYSKYLSTFKLPLIPLIIWLLSFIVLFA